jgi:hypothetical protein
MLAAGLSVTAGLYQQLLLWWCCSYGVGRIACLTFTGWLPTKVKSRNVLGFVAKYRQELMRQ